MYPITPLLNSWWKSCFNSVSIMHASVIWHCNSNIVLRILKAYLHHKIWHCSKALHFHDLLSIKHIESPISGRNPPTFWGKFALTVPGVLGYLSASMIKPCYFVCPGRQALTMVVCICFWWCFRPICGTIDGSVWNTDHSRGPYEKLAFCWTCTWDTLTRVGQSNHNHQG